MSRAAYPRATVQEQSPSAVIGLQLFLPHSTLDPVRRSTVQSPCATWETSQGCSSNWRWKGWSLTATTLGQGRSCFQGRKRRSRCAFATHDGRQVPAGEHRIAIHASAPEAYPGEVVTVSQTLRILPFYHHTLRLLSR